MTFLFLQVGFEVPYYYYHSVSPSNPLAFAFVLGAPILMHIYNCYILPRWISPLSLYNVHFCLLLLCFLLKICFV